MPEYNEQDQKAIDEWWERHQQRNKENLSPEVLGRKKKKQSPGNKLTDDLIKFIKSIGGTARRISYGVRILENGKVVGTGMKDGMEDVTACIPVNLRTRYGTTMKIGVNVAIEVKIGKDRMSEGQVKRSNELTAAGGYYFLASDLEYAKTQILTIINKITECFQSQ